MNHFQLYSSFSSETSTTPTRPPFTDRATRKNKQKLFRSTGSFSVVEDSIVVAPTPRKMASILPSPAPQRREKRRNLNIKPDESVFGEAGQELQTILLFSAPTTPTLESQEFQESSIFHEEIIKEVNEYYSRPESPSMSPPPLRSSNPVPLNSPFQGTEASKEAAFPAAVSSKLKLYKAQRQLKKMTKQTTQAPSVVPKATRKCDLGRGRSKSWPSLPVEPVAH